MEDPTDQTNCVTERDLLRQVASNMTKELVGSKLDQDQAKQLKDAMATNLKNCKAVWQAFEKFIHTQVAVKGRPVDTQVIGMLRMHEQRVQYLPAPDYLQVGKFKPQKGLLPKTHGDGGPFTYSDFYEKVKQVSQLTDTHPCECL